MTKNNLPEGWGNQQNITPDSWTNKSSEKSSKNDKPIKDTFKTNQSTKSESLLSGSHDRSEGADNTPDFKEPVINAAVSEEIDTETKNKSSKSVRVTTVVLAIFLTAALSFLVVFIVLYFNSRNNNSKAEEPKASVVETTVNKTEVTTEKSTEIVTTEVQTTKPKPTIETTTEPTTVQPREEEQSSNLFESYLVWLDEGIYVRESPDQNSNVTYKIDVSTKYTIVDEAYDDIGNLWGKLKSGVGWVNLTEATDGNQDHRISAARRYYMTNPYMEYESVGNIVFCYYSVYPVDQMTPVEDGYYKKINSFSAENVSGNIYNLHIEGEYKTYDGVTKRLCCYEKDNELQTLYSHFISEPVLNETFNTDTSITVVDGTEVVVIELV